MNNSFLRILLRSFPLLILLLLVDSLFTIDTIQDAVLTYFYSFKWFYHILLPYLGVTIYGCYYAKLNFFIETILLELVLSQEGSIKALLFKSQYKIQFMIDGKLLVSKREGINHYRALISFLPSNKVEIEGNTYLVRKLKECLVSNKN